MNNNKLILCTVPRPWTPSYQIKSNWENLCYVFIGSEHPWLMDVYISFASVLQSTSRFWSSACRWWLVSSSSSSPSFAAAAAADVGEAGKYYVLWSGGCEIWFSIGGGGGGGGGGGRRHNGLFFCQARLIPPSPKACQNLWLQFNSENNFALSMRTWPPKTS